MASGENLVFEGEAYEMAVLHAHKYSSMSIGGILLGEFSKSSFRVSLVVPLVHGLPLAPLLEAALPQIEMYGKEKGCSILGCYFANEGRGEVTLSPLFQMVASQLAAQSQFPPLTLLMNTEKLQEGEFAFDTYTSDKEGGSWKLVNKPVVVQPQFEDVTRRLLRHIAQGHSESLLDFSDHLVDITSDWTNEKLLEKLRE
mmetsp:Transcript_9370/g.12613  ORF Transcript_9370/g.12613 Transcript_9370/m.12613 type:complete len:199 (-) Transcript_9370:51-647(-)|eukprot:CAMPEP_0201491890 /NCGR_PEP_ID=MMETSP0151_2-20130828/31684_1 /ASSEMBLY_ACC=CAM_ASM_000257 /TAXON_ID=200890 /ORGANISM="Paramoeba atlantica, Strain 621/1 / CCAP 1560/9" /LENGTH=198 /DNA_ID=CAMNT_0047878475 /DNA_START=20 /DNA_END=616 /DNA_ORIENTATION=+